MNTRRSITDGLDCISLKGLVFTTLIGINPEELDNPQPIMLDLDLYLMPIEATRTDDLEQSISYAAVYDQVAHLVHTRHFGLIERLAGALAEMLLKKHPYLMAIEVTVQKPQAPLPGPFSHAGVTIFRTRADFRLLTSAELSLGSNQGDRLATLRLAVGLLGGHPQIEDLMASSVYETTPVGLVEQPEFYNLAVRFKTSLNPFELLNFCQQIEQKAARERTIRWGPRTLDIDILNYGTIVSQSVLLLLPHPRISERDFVRIPLLELATGQIHETPDVRFTCKLS